MSECVPIMFDLFDQHIVFNTLVSHAHSFVIVALLTLCFKHCCQILHAWTYQPLGPISRTNSMRMRLIVIIYRSSTLRWCQPRLRRRGCMKLHLPIYLQVCSCLSVLWYCRRRFTNQVWSRFWWTYFWHITLHSFGIMLHSLCFSDQVDMDDLSNGQQAAELRDAEAMPIAQLQRSMCGHVSSFRQWFPLMHTSMRTLSAPRHTLVAC